MFWPFLFARIAAVLGFASISSSALRLRLRQYQIGTREADLPFPIGPIACFLRPIFQSRGGRSIFINLGPLTY
jgi:hypothetical protein